MVHTRQRVRIIPFEWRGVMKGRKLDISIQIERAGKSKMVARARGIAVDVPVYYARERSYKNVGYEPYLHYIAIKIMHKLTNDLEMMVTRDYYQVRDTIKGMLKMLHEYDIMRACSADVTVCLLECDNARTT